MTLLFALLAGFLLLACLALAVAYRRLERTARRNRVAMRALTDTLPLGIATVDGEARHGYANQAYADWFGLSRDSLPGTSVRDVGHPAYSQRVEAVQARADTSEEASTFEIETQTADLRRRARVTVIPFHPVAEGGQPIMLVVISDVSANELLEARTQRHLSEMAHVARLATMGELAAKLAHELNQPLTAISGYTRASLRMMRSGRWEASELVEALEDASLQAERAADIIRGLRNFLRKSPAERQRLELKSLFEEVVRLVQHQARARRVEISINHATDLPEIRANRTEIEQVLFNLLLNAIEAIPEGGRGRRQVTLNTGRTADGGIEVAVADSGSGFVEGVGEHLYDPFFSTKGEGMGMGLSICRTIVEAHGGTLRAHNNAMGGATFRFTLPGSEEEGGDEA